MLGIKFSGKYALQLLYRVTYVRKKNNYVKKCFHLKQTINLIKSRYNTGWLHLNDKYIQQNKKKKKSKEIYSEVQL